MHRICVMYIAINAFGKGCSPLCTAVSMMCTVQSLKPCNDGMMHIKSIINFQVNKI